jgi:hypothetical protein
MATDGYVLKVSSALDGTTHLEVEASSERIRQVLDLLLAPVEHHANGAASVPRGDHPPTHAAQPARRRGRGRPKGTTTGKPTGPTRPVPVQPALERKCRFCANLFRSPHSGQLYCSAACKEKMHAVQPLPRPPATDTVL